MGNKRKESIISNFKYKNPVWYFSIVFVITFVILYILSYSIDEGYTQFFIDRGNSHFDTAINKNYELNRYVEIMKKANTATQIHLQTVFQDKKNPNGTLIAKDIYTDIRREALIPTIFLLALVIATPLKLKRKIISIIVAFVLINLYVFFKLYTFAYDNYSYPEFQLIELSALVSPIVYGANFFFEMTGSSTIVIIPVIIWIVSCWSDDLLNLLKFQTSNS
jgi:hypothetical protein